MCAFEAPMKKSVVVAVLMVFSFSILIGFSSSYACGSVLHVGGVGEGNFSSISDALAVADSNDSVFIHAGIYVESVVVEQSNISFVGEEKNSTIIDAGALDCPIILKDDCCTVSNLTLTNSKMWFPFAGVQIFGQNNRVENVILTGNYYGCTLFESACFNEFSNVSMVKNKQCGAYLSGSCSNSFSSVFVSNHSFNGFGFYDLSNDNIVVNCFFEKNGNCGVNIRDSDRVLLKNNVMVNNSIGIHIPPLPYKTTLINNTVSLNTVVDVELQQTSFAASTVACVVLLFAAFVFFELFFIRRR